MSLKLATAVTTVIFLVLTVVVTVQSGLLVPPPDPDDYGTATVTLQDQNGTERATVDVRLANTSDKRFVGLSNTASLDQNEGMLFVHDSEGTYAYVMRNMSFPLDIIFIAPNGTITRIHHAATEPDGGDLTQYRGTGKYVLEVNRGYTNRTGIEAGDTAVIPDAVAATPSGS